MNNTNYCKGCKIISNGIKTVCFEDNNTGDCPCTECIVKMMCEIIPCEKWLKWRREISKNLTLRQINNDYK